MGLSVWVVHRVESGSSFMSRRESALMGVAATLELAKSAVNEDQMPMNDDSWVWSWDSKRGWWETQSAWASRGSLGDSVMYRAQEFQVWS